uniref:Dehydrogenase/reductase SDR family member 11 n=1 Tax=Monodon monoceros TaxID=40151 RepID=A0A8C6BWB6_MONMO
MWPFAEQRRVEPGAEAGQSGGRSRRSPDWARSGAVAAVVTREWPGPYDPGQSSAIQVLGSPGEVGGRLGTLARAGMERWRDRLALVTGQGLKVVGRARTVSNIEELAAECKSAGYPGTLTPYRCDLSNEEDILSMFSAVRSQHSGVDICINNAGLARPDTLLSGSTGGWKDMFNVRAAGLICPRGASQSMRERKVDDGHTININSMSGHQVPPQSVAHFYSATKYAVTALTEGLRQELREAQTHIRATCISPGVVETQFAFKLQDKDPEKAAATYEHMKCLKPEDVAKAVIYVLSTPPHVQIGDIQMRPTEQVT